MKRVEVGHDALVNTFVVGQEGEERIRGDFGMRKQTTRRNANTLLPLHDDLDAVVEEAEDACAVHEGEVDLDFFFVADDVEGRNIGGGVVFMESYGEEVSKFGKRGRNSTREGVFVKVQAEEGREIAKLGRQFSAQLVVVQVQAGESRECLYLYKYGAI